MLSIMRDHARDAVSMLGEKSPEEIDAAAKLRYALHYLAEHVGVAAGRVSKGVKVRHSDVPWDELEADAQRLIANYDQVTSRFLHHAIASRFPGLVARLNEIIAQIASQQSSAPHARPRGPIAL